MDRRVFLEGLAGSLAFTCLPRPAVDPKRELLPVPDSIECVTTCHSDVSPGLVDRSRVTLRLKDHIHWCEVDSLYDNRETELDCGPYHLLVTAHGESRESLHFTIYL